MESDLDELQLIIQHPKYYLSNHFFNLKNQVDIIYAKQLINENDLQNKSKIHKIWTQIIDKINSLEKECLKNKIKEPISDDFSIKKTLFSNKTIIFLDRCKCSDKSLFKGDQLIKLVVLNDEYISEQGIESMNKRYFFKSNKP